SAASCRLTGGSTLRSDAPPATRRTLMHAGSAAGGRSVLAAAPAHGTPALLRGGNGDTGDQRRRGCHRQDGNPQDVPHRKSPRWVSPLFILRKPWITRRTPPEFLTAPAISSTS